MAPGVSSCHFREVPPSISFSGSGFLATYQLGVAQCLQNNAPWILRMAPCVMGASAGSLVAAAVVCEISLVAICNEMVNFAKEMKSFTLGPFNPSINVFHWLEYVLNKHLPANAHQLATGRLSVAMTRLTDSKLIMMSEFQSKEDVVQALLCSCFVPGYCGMLPPTFKGERYMDGGFSSMQPMVPGQILTVCPFSGDIDICPADTPSMWDMVVSGTTLKGNMANSSRIFNALYPMALETLDHAFDSGYKDAVIFLQRNNLASHSMIHAVPKEPLNHNQKKKWTGQKSKREEREEMEKERVTYNECTQTSSSSEYELAGKQHSKGPNQFNMAKTVLLVDMVAYLSMFGLPARFLSHLLIPLMPSFYTSQQSVPILEVVLWAWYSMRQFLLFFTSVVVFTIKKNLQNRFMPILLLLLWMKMLVLYEAPRGKKRASPGHKVPSSARSQDGTTSGKPHRQLSPSQHYKNTELPYM